MARARSIGVAQTVPARGDVAANVRQHLRLARVAAEGDSGWRAKALMLDAF